MDVVYERCCGLDIHKKSVVACLITPGAGGRGGGGGGGGAPGKEVRTFGTMTDDLLALADWLAAAGCTHVAMEATGVYWKSLYWKSLYNLLEGSFALLLVNAQHVKQVPGRKTDVRDCEWLADLLRHGLLRGSFVPDRSASPAATTWTIVTLEASFMEIPVRPVSSGSRTTAGMPGPTGA